MKKTLLLDTIRNEIDNYRKNNFDYKILDNIKYLFEEYLQFNPYDTEIWLNFAVCMYRFAEETDWAEECLRKILAYDPSNIYATMLLTYVCAHSSHIDDHLFSLLCKLKTEDKEILSMIEYEKVWYFNDNEMYEQVLTNSVNLWDKHVWNNVKLGWIYLSTRRIREGQELLKKGLDNVTFIYDGRPYDKLSIEEYFNEGIRGIHLSRSNYNIILESFDPKSSWRTGDLKNNNLIES